MNVKQESFGYHNLWFGLTGNQTQVCRFSSRCSIYYLTAVASFTDLFSHRLFFSDSGNTQTPRTFSFRLISVLCHNGKETVILLLFPCCRAMLQDTLLVREAFKKIFIIKKQNQFRAGFENSTEVINIAKSKGIIDIR